jgi:Protein of unknown function (DUF3046)
VTNQCAFGPWFAVPVASGAGRSVTRQTRRRLCNVRLTEFWRRMEHHLGPQYADSWARDQVLAGLSDRTVHQALAAGEDPKLVWRAVCDVLRLPPSER